MTRTWRVSSPETIAQEGGGLLITVRVDPYDRKVLTATLALIAKAPELHRMLASCLAYFDDMKHASMYCENNDHDRPCSGIDFAPDAEWLAPIRALLRDIEGRP